MAEIIKERFFQNGKKIRVIYSRNKDVVQKYKKNYPNKIINKYWKPAINLRLGIYKIFNSYLEKL